jgi:hypothetical protein
MNKAVAEAIDRYAEALGVRLIDLLENLLTDPIFTLIRTLILRKMIGGVRGTCWPVPGIGFENGFRSARCFARFHERMSPARMEERGVISHSTSPPSSSPWPSSSVRAVGSTR